MRREEQVENERRRSWENRLDHFVSLSIPGCLMPLARNNSVGVTLYGGAILMGRMPDGMEGEEERRG